MGILALIIKLVSRKQLFSISLDIWKVLFNSYTTILQCSTLRAKAGYGALKDQALQDIESQE